MASLLSRVLSGVVVARAASSSSVSAGVALRFKASSKNAPPPPSSSDSSSSDSDGEGFYPELAGTKTHANLIEAFKGESMANRRYLYFAQQADVEGESDVAAVFRSTAEGETGHAFGHLEFLEEVGDPATDLPIGSTQLNLESAIAGETHEYTDMYPGMAAVAREEGHDDVADWFETLAMAEKSHAGRFQKALNALVREQEQS